MQASRTTWVQYAQTFLATGDDPSLATAISCCKDTRIVQFLSRSEVKNRCVDPKVARDLFRQLRSEGREKEAQIIGLFGLFTGVPPGISPKGMSPEMTQGAINVLGNAISVCRDEEFPACEAHFDHTLGCFLADLGQFEQARQFLERSTELYRQLCAHSPELYRRDLTNVLHNLRLALER